MKTSLTAIALVMAVVACVTVSGAGAADDDPYPAILYELLDRPYSLDLPPRGSEWHAVSSVVGAGDGGWTLTQDAFQDWDDDDSVSIHDWIWGPVIAERHLVREAIDVLAVSRLYRVEGSDRIFHPRDVSPDAPFGEIWQIILPDEEWGTALTVDDWTDAEPPGPSAGDAVRLDGIWHTVARISLCVEGYQAVPVSPATWGRIKAQYGRGG